MNVAIVGLGNVGSSLLLALASISGANEIGRVFVIGRSSATSNGALLDAASAFPAFASRCTVADREQLADSDLIVFCAGALKEKGENRIDHCKKNARIFSRYFEGIELRATAILIVVPSPVDDLTIFASAFCNLDHSRIMGFGGDLDFHRLEYRLMQDALTVESAAVVGEHGPRVIPVYWDETVFDRLMEETRTFLSRTHNESGRPRNLSSGVLLSKLVDTIVTDRRTEHFLCAYQPDYEVFLTWPFTVGIAGVIGPGKVALGPKSQLELSKLIGDRQSASGIFMDRNFCSE